MIEDIKIGQLGDSLPISTGCLSKTGNDLLTQYTLRDSEIMLSFISSLGISLALCV